MYGAVPYLMKSFALDRDAAFKVVCQWVDRQVEAPPEVIEPRRRKSVRRRAA